jgi:SAM-dependent methyltransferase
VADAEHLPFESDSFDLGYSFGVLHHTPDTAAALAELVRTVKPGGEIKVMLYGRRCMTAFKLWVKHAALRGRPWRDLRWVMANHLESPGTKGYSRREFREILCALPLANIRVHGEVTASDYLAFSAFPPVNALCRLILCLAGDRPDWRRTDYDLPFKPRPLERGRCEFTGNPLGWFHCISAIKV